MLIGLFQKKTKDLPDSPGVYFFIGSKKEILYIGKATSLKDRVQSYFNKDIVLSRGPRIVKMIEVCIDINFLKTDSVLEALILEANLIKKYQPVYNVLNKDDKSFNYVVITDEKFPRVLIIRGKNLAKDGKQKYVAKYVFGPYPHGTALKEAIKIVRRIFPFRTSCVPFDEISNKKNSKPCFDSQIGLCPGVCSGKISQKDYSKIISHIKLFFEGKKSILLKKLEKEMKEYASRHEFEKAQITKKTIFALQHIQDIALIKRNLNKDDSSDQFIKPFRIESYDIAHISGKFVVGVMTVVSNGEPQKSHYRKFKIKDVKSDGINDVAHLKEVLKRRFNHSEWTFPDLIVVDGSIQQINGAKEVLKEIGVDIEVVSIVKDERHKPREVIGGTLVVKKHRDAIILANSESHRFAIKYHREKRDKL